MDSATTGTPLAAAFAGIAFLHPERARTNLGLIERILPPRLWALLATLLAQVPDPDESLNDLERYLRGIPPAVLRHLEEHPAALHYLLLVFSHSRFLSETLIGDPDLILWLHRPSRRPAADRFASLLAPEDLREELARFHATHFSLPPSVLLARFKRREYLRIMLRDVLGVSTVAETTLELSHLADVILESALALPEQKLARAFGWPEFLDPAGHRRRSRLVVLSLGKLGGQELNYSSDIDLLFLFEADGQSAGGEAGSISNGEWFARLAAAALKIISEPTREGAVFRVDLRLRPEGTRGDVAISLAAAARYYASRAREWELQMLIKARPSAGAAELGRQFLRQVRPLIFRPPEAGGRALAAALESRREMERELRRTVSPSAAARNIKLSPGGIRDVEFLAQALQRIYGGTDPWLAASVAGSTLVALQRLHDKGRLGGHDFFRLATAYQFLRQVEHRLQLRDGLQVHTLPSSAGELERLARCLGVEPAEGQSAAATLTAKLDRHLAEVREIYERKLERGEAWAPAPGSPRAAGGPALAPLGLLAAAHPAILEAAMNAGWNDNPDLRRGLGQFLSAALADPELARRLARQPEAVRALAGLVERSDLVAAMLSRHPEEYELAIAADPQRLEKLLAEVSGWGSGSGSLDDLRVAARQGLLLLAARSALGQSRPYPTFAALTHLADELLRLTLARLAEEAMPGIALETSPFAVLALGRLGSREMDIGSDADLVFVTAQGLSAEDRGPWRKLAERFVNALSSHTRHGLLYPVDTRLRPRGAEGEFVQPLSYVENYFRHEAAAWEAVTFLKSRPLAGNLALGGEALLGARRAMGERFACGDGVARLRQELQHMRDLLDEQWRADRSRSGLKLAPGGYHDLEYALGFPAVVGAVAPEGRTLLEQIRTLEAAGLLEGDAARTLRAAATLFRSADHALRLVTGHPLGRKPDPAVSRRAARLLAAWDVPDADRFLEAIEERRAEVIRLYRALVG